LRTLRAAGGYPRGLPGPVLRTHLPQLSPPCVLKRALGRPGPSSQSELERVASLEHPAGRVSIKEPGEEPFERYPLAQAVKVHAFFSRLTLETVGERTLERLWGRVLHFSPLGSRAGVPTRSQPRGGPLLRSGAARRPPDAKVSHAGACGVRARAQQPPVPPIRGAPG
jgi:hypothetical protein